MFETIPGPWQTSHPRPWELRAGSASQASQHLQHLGFAALSSSALLEKSDLQNQSAESV